MRKGNGDMQEVVSIAYGVILIISMGFLLLLAWQKPGREQQSTETGIGGSTKDRAYQCSSGKGVVRTGRYHREP